MDCQDTEGAERLADADDPAEQGDSRVGIRLRPITHRCSAVLVFKGSSRASLPSFSSRRARRFRRALAACLVGCAGPMTAVPTEAQFSAIQPGMTREEVLSRVGRPT